MAAGTTAIVAVAIYHPGPAAIAFERTYRPLPRSTTVAALLRSALDRARAAEPIAWDPFLLSSSSLSAGLDRSGKAAAARGVGSAGLPAPLAVLLTKLGLVVVLRRAAGLVWAVAIEANGGARPFAPLLRHTSAGNGSAPPPPIETSGPDRATGTTPCSGAEYHACLRLLDALHLALSQYWTPLTAATVTREAVQVALVVDELTTGGAGVPSFPPPNQLTAILPVPDALMRMATTVMGTMVQPSGPPGTLGKMAASTPWRRNNVKHSSNEVYVDVEERVSGAITLGGSGGGGSNRASSRSTNASSSSSSPRSGTVHVAGAVLVNSKLSGSPEVHIALSGPLADLTRGTVHDCVAATLSSTASIGRLPADLAGVPADGRSTFASYTMASATSARDTGASVAITASKWLTATARRDSAGRIILSVSVPPATTSSDGGWSWAAADALAITVRVPPRCAITTFRASCGVARSHGTGSAAAGTGGGRRVEWLPLQSAAAGGTNDLMANSGGNGAQGSVAAASSAAAATAAAALSKLAVSASASAAPSIARGLGAAASGIVAAGNSVAAAAATSSSPSPFYSMSSNGGGHHAGLLSGKGGGDGNSSAEASYPTMTIIFSQKDSGTTTPARFAAGVVMSGAMVGKVASGIQVSRVSVVKEDYKVYQAVRYSTILDGLEFRVSC
ncbi:hypothetical protein BC828DRAFT_376176 [Blastocladiella britannica]|nr:hypothetical protein BC828DRAFT_376176 [Blastocladiella britannica]